MFSGSKSKEIIIPKTFPKWHKKYLIKKSQGGHFLAFVQTKFSMLLTQLLVIKISHLTLVSTVVSMVSQENHW